MYPNKRRRDHYVFHLSIGTVGHRSHSADDYLLNQQSLDEDDL